MSDDNRTPFEILGVEKTKRIAYRFYEVMAAEERELAELHELTEQGLIDPAMQERFFLFLQSWLGGPMEYVEKHGHPRLRMRHAEVPIDKPMRDAWLRCMATALEEEEIPATLFSFLMERFLHVGTHLLNR